MTSISRLKRANVRAVLVPLRRPIIAAIGNFKQWPLILVDLEMEGGTVGSSYIAPYREQAVLAIIAEIDDIVAQLAGRSAPFEAFQSAQNALNVVGVSGVSTLATAAVDMALWDALAKEAGLPLACLLGGSIGPIRAYNSNGLWRHSVDTLGVEAKELLAEGGFTAAKLRLGNEHLRDDLAAIRAVRDAVGAEVDIMVDFNQALGLGDAIRRCCDLDNEGLYWLEEPILYNNVAGYAELAKRVKTPLQMGENFYGERDLMNFLNAKALHYVMPDLMRIGGISGWIRTAGVAAAAGIQMSNHVYPEVSAHLLRVTPTAHWLEWVDWANPILADPIVPSKGQITALNKPGTGIEWNEKAIAKYGLKD
ncbi:enolase C-terminal domain-like protein [Granulicella sp. L60]|uniref:enolase C-terminal domain-like protein n=1 Tax=Granulicella sp. L60 TaxID=1641866 RepID=UPI00131BD681|nr:enolase C-terminal domain-like protein [Granulicella sp. L60]